MHCELIVPGLLSAPTEARYPALELLLARGRRETADSRSLEQWLHDAFEQPGSALAAGALTLAAHGGDPGAVWWSRADPVHLSLMRDRVIVVPGEALDIAPAEAEALAEGLNRHFAGRAPHLAHFRALEPRRWVARLESDLSFADGPALHAAGRDVATVRGNEALLTEIQMFLHAHAVNEAREARGELAVNSLWLWGAGRAPRVAHGAWRSVAAGDPAALGLAQLAGMRRQALPASADAWLEQQPAEGRHLALLDALCAPLALEQQAEYEEGIEALEQRWFAPLVARLRAGRIGMVSVRVPDAAPGAGFETARGDLRRFWRRPRSIRKYAGHTA
jgi:hypothetical protein